MIAAYTVIVAEASRLPMVAAWDHLFPAWFTRLHPRFRTPTRSLTVIVLLAVLLSIVHVPHTWLFGLKVALTGLGINLIGAGIYWRGARPRPVRRPFR